MRIALIVSPSCNNSPQVFRLSISFFYVQYTHIPQHGQHGLHVLNHVVQEAPRKGFDIASIPSPDQGCQLVQVPIQKWKPHHVLEILVHQQHLEPQGLGVNGVHVPHLLMDRQPSRFEIGIVLMGIVLMLFKKNKLVH